jgi:hypothetical protein
MRNFIICTPLNYIEVIKEDENEYEVLIEEPKGKIHSVDIGVDGNLILSLILKKWSVMISNGFI